MGEEHKNTQMDHSISENGTKAASMAKELIKPETVSSAMVNGTATEGTVTAQ